MNKIGLLHLCVHLEVVLKARDVVSVGCEKCIINGYWVELRWVE